MSKKKNGEELTPYNNILPEDPKDAKIKDNAPRSTSPTAEQYSQRGTAKPVEPLRSREYRTTPRSSPAHASPARAIQGSSELDDEK